VVSIKETKTKTKQKYQIEPTDRKPHLANVAV